MQVTHWHAACQTIEVPGLRILCDPWFGYGDGHGGGNYDGSWAPSVPLPDLPTLLDHLGPVDYVYVSHLHPDHYSPEFLRAYFARYPEARLLTSDEPMFQAALMRDGFAPRLMWAESRTIEARAWVVRHPVDAMDSALVVVAGDYAAAHLNDCRYHARLTETIGTLVGHRTLVAFLPFCGAGEWPQTFDMQPHENKQFAAQKRLAFKKMFCKYVDDLSPARAIPTAGESEYIGPLAALNPRRGLPTPQEAALWRLPGQALFYGDRLDLAADRGIEHPLPPWEPASPPKFLGYRYERDWAGVDPERLERLLPGLAVKAAHNLIGRATLAKPYWLAVGTPTRCCVAFDLSGQWGVQPTMAWSETAKLGEPREEIRLDPRALMSAFIGLSNWNTLCGGGHLQSRRFPLTAYCEELYYRLIPHFHT